MGYWLGKKSSFDKQFKKLQIQVQEEVKKKLNEIHQNPFSGIALTNGWKPAYKFKFNLSGTEYRIIFTVNSCEEKCITEDYNCSDEFKPKCEGFILFHLVGTREKFNQLYKSDKKAIKNYLHFD